MIIAADIGNTNIKIGLFDKDRLVKSWRISTDVHRTSDEHGSILKQLFFAAGIDADSITGGIISSVIPQLNYTIMHMMEFYLDVIPIVVGAGIKTGLNVKYENPKELGSDRLINCVAAAKKYGAPFVLIDFGTATTFNVVNEKNEFVGGCIAGGRNYFHINSAGDAEPCVFIHYSDSNIREKTLLEALRSPLFQAYHDGQPFNENMLRPCPMLENPEKLRDMVAGTDAHSTDLQSPETVEHLLSLIHI